MTVNREDILITRVVDQAASAQDWKELEALALADPGVWKRLADEVRTQSAMETAVGAATACADAVDLDIDRVRATGALHLRLRAWTGWAAAAVIALAWIGGATMLGSNALPGANIAGLTLPTSADEALDQYRALGVQEGRYLYELPMVMVDSQRDPVSDRIEILYMRRFIERAEISAMYTTDPQQGLASTVAVPVAVPVRGRTFLPSDLH